MVRRWIPFVALLVAAGALLALLKRVIEQHKQGGHSVSVPPPSPPPSPPVVRPRGTAQPAAAPQPASASQPPLPATPIVPLWDDDGDTGAETSADEEETALDKMFMLL